MAYPLVSVLMTAYNREQYIATAIESVLAQSMVDFELIIVDDGSTDHSLEITKSYEHDNRVKVYVNERNLGDYPNRNRAASLARGKYLKYVDSDDAIYPHCLEVMTHIMERYPKAGMLLCAWSENDPFYPFELSPLEAYRRCFIHEERMSNSPLTTMFRKHAFDEIGGFDTQTWPLSCDWDLVLRMARKFNTVFAPTGLVFYRIHENQVSFTERDNYLKHRTPVGAAIAINALRHINCPLPQNEKDWAIRNKFRLALKFAIGLAIKKGKPLTALQLLRSLKITINEILSIFHIKKPLITLPEIGSEPDWADYPRSRVDRLNNANQTDRINNGVSIIVAGQGSVAAWEKTIRSALVQSEDQLEVIIIRSDSCSNPPNELIQKYSFVRLINLSEDNIWIARNRAAERAYGNYLKFVEPGILLYPYAAEFYAHTLNIYDEVGIIAWGQLQCVPYFLKLDAKTAIACDFHQGWWVFRVPLSCATIRKKSFIKQRGFNPQWEKWTTYELLFRLSLDSGLVHGMLGLIKGDTVEYPASISQISPMLQDHLENLIHNNFGESLDKKTWIEDLAEEATKLKEKAVTEHAWDWNIYPWAQSNNAIKKRNQNVLNTV